MTGGEDFLSRWSRRKRAATESTPPSGAATDPPAPPSVREEPAAPAGTAVASGPNETEPFDPASLPSIDSIVAGTDISGFLKRGVPLDLTRAALRRAWSADPAIRDFIGLAENAWDFNDPTAMPGFGPLDQSPDEIRQMLAQVMGEVRRDAEAALSSDDVPASKSTERSNAISGSSEPESAVREQAVANAQVHSPTTPGDVASTPPLPDVAMQNGRIAHAEEGGDRPVPRRTHGGALPR